MAPPPRRTVLGFALLLVAAGCETQPTHEVLSLTDVTPRQLEARERVVLQGSGLPLPNDIRRITLRIAGTLSRPGAPPCPRPVSLTLTDPPEALTVYDPATGGTRAPIYSESAVHALRVEAGSRVEFSLSDEMVATLSRCSDGVASGPHATLALTGPRGGITLTIETTNGTTLAAARPLRGPLLELLSSDDRGLSRALDARREAERALGGIGVELAPSIPGEVGLPVARVTPGSIADEGGINDGDILQRLDGLTLLSVTDFRPAPGTVAATVTVRRADNLEEHPLRVGRLDPVFPADLSATLGLLCALVAVTLIARGGVPRSVASLAALMAKTPPRTLHGPALAFSGRVHVPAWPAARSELETVALWSAAVSTVALAAPLGPLVLTRDVDLTAPWLVTVVGSLALAWSRPPSWSKALPAVGRQLLRELPLALCLAGCASIAGSLHSHDLIDIQGGAPWRWLALRNPLTLALTLGAFASMTLSPELERRPHPRPAEWAWRWGRALLVSAALLGAWRLPGVEAAAQDVSASLLMLGAMAWTAKAWALVYLAAALRQRLRRLRAKEASRFMQRTLIPGAALTVALLGAVRVADARLTAVKSGLIAAGAGMATSLAVAFALGLLIVRRRATDTPRHAGSVAREATVVGRESLHAR